MRKIKELIERIKRCWVLSRKIRLIKNGATDVEEVWIETSTEYNHGICCSLHRIA